MAALKPAFSHPGRRSWLWPACLFLGLGLAGPLGAQPVEKPSSKPKTTVADLRYGVSLYHYYQQDYLSALTELMVADTRDGIQGHDQHPELIAGGISLAFGMENHAERLFYTLLQDDSRPLEQRDAAWFYLGKLHYTRGNWDDAELSFARVSDRLSPRLKAEMESLRINLQIRRQQLVPIPLRQLGEKQLRDWSPFALYNLAAAFARQGNYAQARDYYRALLKSDLPQSPRARREFLALRDLTYTALGYTFLNEKSYSAAITEFTQVRQGEPGANRALLGYGWAALQQEDYTLALRPWQLLAQGSLIYPEVQEAQLALAYSYEKLGADGEALLAYQEAEARFSEEIQRLRDMRVSLTQGELLTLIGSPAEPNARLQEESDGEMLTAAITDDGNNWLKLSQTSIIKTRSAYLRQLFARTDFQAQVLDLRDLLRLRDLLADWQYKLVLYLEMIEEKQALRHRSEEQLAREQLLNSEQQLQAQKQQLESRIEALLASESPIVLADADTRALAERIRGAENTLARMRQQGEDTREQEERLRLYKGIVYWRAAQQYPDAVWQIEKQRRALDEGLTQLAEVRQRIHQLTLEDPDIQDQQARLRQLQLDTDIHLGAAETLIDQRSLQLKHAVEKELEEQESRLRAYLTQAQLSVARLYDTALRRQEP